MQNDPQSPEAWQQPEPVRSGAPFQTPPSDSQSVADVESTDFSSDPAVAPETPSADTNTDDDALLRWQATEYIDHERSPAWYIGLGVVVVVLMAVAILLFRSWTFAILVPVMAAALYVYARRPAAVVDYVLTKKGLYINDKLLPYDSFRAFSVLSHAGHHSAVLIPRKRFQLAQTVYFPEEVGEPLVDMLAARMPMQEAKPDLFDKIISRLRM